MHIVNQIQKEKKKLYELNNGEARWDKIRKFYKGKLVEYGVMRALPNACKTLAGVHRKI